MNLTVSTLQTKCIVIFFSILYILTSVYGTAGLPEWALYGIDAEEEASVIARMGGGGGVWLLRDCSCI